MKRILCYTVVLIGATGLCVGCTTTQDGAVAGGLIGAGLGAIIGNQSGHAGEGALIGAGAGAGIGAIVGNEVGHSRHQRVYNDSRPAPPRQRGHYENRIVTTPSGEKYEERVWIPG